MATPKNQPSKTTQHMTGQPALTKNYLSGMKKTGVALSIFSIVVSILGILNGFAFYLTAVFGAFAIYLAIRTKTPYLSVIGGIALVLGFVSIILAF